MITLRQARGSLAKMKLVGDVPDSIDIVRYRWYAGGRNSKRHRRCTVIEVSGSHDVGATDQGDLIVMEIERPSIQHFAGFKR